ncbi:MAG: hypothetical protein Q8Q09_15410 [Deltaproteobacteria bacterium]|nr:hypothetical protein [Deltaproteobacteria bacterium]
MFTPMIAGAVVAGSASVISLTKHYRRQLGPMTFREARQLRDMPTTPIGQAQSGLVKIVGRVVGTQTEWSFYHRVPCVSLVLHHFEVSSGMVNSQRTLVRVERWSHPFFVEDDTGRLAIDPTTVRIDHEREGTDLESTIEEHRLRAGERVVVLGKVRRIQNVSVHPMRRAPTDIESGLVLVGSPLVSWRSEAEVAPRLVPPSGSMVLTSVGAVLGALGALLDL